MICSDPTLSRLDDELNREFAKALQYTNNQDLLRENEKNWLKYSRDLCASPDCMARVYRQRIQELRSYYMTLQAASNQVSANQPVKSSASQNNETYNLRQAVALSIVIVLAVVYLIMFLVGLAGKVVVYYDTADLIISLMPWLMLFVGFILMVIFQPDQYTQDRQQMLMIQKVVLWGTAIVVLLFTFWSIGLSVKYNQSWLIGIPYGLFKISLGLIGVFAFMGQIAKMKDEKTTRNQFTLAVLTTGVFAWLAKKLINGREVYKRKKWKYL